MPTLFEKIIAGEIPCYKVWENPQHLAFLDINPRAQGHTLVIPKKPIASIFELSEEDYLALWKSARQVAKKLEDKLKCKRVLIAVWGWEVPHTHIHLIPTHDIEDVPFPEVNQEAKKNLEESAKALCDLD